jgi:hypothetical protein
MVFSSIEKLRKFLLTKSQNMSLHEIQRTYFPMAKTGTLSRIVNDPTYEPQHKSVRDGLMMTDACPRCHRKAAKPHQPRHVLEGSPCHGCQLLKEFREKRKRLGSK